MGERHPGVVSASSSSFQFKLSSVQASGVTQSNFCVLNFGCPNVNCLSNKLDYINTSVNDYSLHILGICETCLTNQTPDLLPGYEIVHTDTSGHIPNPGVCPSVRKSISHESVPYNCPNLLITYLSSYFFFLFFFS